MFLKIILEPPAAFDPYKLPKDDVEKPFDPISAYAIEKSGLFAQSPENQGFYALDADQLESFLKLKLDKRVKGRRIKDVIEEYTENLPGLKNQLYDLKRRIKGIADMEKDRNDDLKKRILKFETGNFFTH